MLVHPQDLSIMLLPSLIVGWKILQKHLVKKEFAKLVKEAVLFGALPVIVLLVLLPTFLFVWKAHGAQQFNIGFYGVRENFFSRNYTGGLVYPDIFFMPWIVLVILGVGILQMIANAKKYKIFLYTLLYFFIVAYISALIFSDPYYFVRMRTMTPFLVIPVVAYTMVYFIEKYMKDKSWHMPAIALVAVLFIISGFVQYNKLVPQLSGEHISMDEWEAYRWIHENTEKTDRILFFGSVFQQEFLYTKRMVAAIDMNEYQRLLTEYLATNRTSLFFTGMYGGDTLRSVHKVKNSYFSYGTYSEPNSTLYLLDFDYVFFQDISQQVAQANYLFGNEFINNYGFSLVYNKNGYIIIKNGQK
ncbi:TPA: hypothetical protein HA239_00355 [Candidatus Woesearchaeota archaeon]|nr:hypothetical protein [Candidatus Woesearchaeota archaeon]